MSHYKTKQALITHLLNNLPSGVTSDDVAFENREFNPKGKNLWLSAYYMPATTEAMNKSNSSSNEDRGWLQVSVFVKLNSANFDNSLLYVIDHIKTAFKYNTILVYNGQSVATLDSNITVSNESEGFHQRNITIDFLTFSEK